jgi:hypothetical protein
MNTTLRTVAVTLGMAILGTAFAFSANAQCGAINGPNTSAAVLQQRSLQARSESRPVELQPASKHGSDDSSIVGFWRVKFVSKDTTDGDPKFLAGPCNRQFLSRSVGEDRAIQLQTQSFCVEFRSQRKHDRPSQHP